MKISWLVSVINEALILEFDHMSVVKDQKFALCYISLTFFSTFVFKLDRAMGEKCGRDGNE